MTQEQKTLKNGAFVIEYHYSRLNDRRTVVAEWWGSCPFVTWRVDEEGNAWLGHYFQSLDEAMQDFQKRID